MLPKISIIIPTFNSESFIINALNSIKEQEFTNFEVLIVDAGSIDNTRKISENYDNRFKFMELKDSRQGEARNLGISISKGEFIMFLDSDDSLSNKTVLKDCFELINEDTNVDFYNFSVTFEQNDELVRRVGSNINGCIQGRSKILSLGLCGKEVHTIPWNKVYKSDFIKSNHISFPPLKEQEDMVFVIHCCMKANKIKFSNNNIVTADVRDESLSRTMTSVNVGCCLDVFNYIEKLLKKDGLDGMFDYEFKLYKMRTASYIILMALYRISSNSDFMRSINIINKSKVMKNNLSFKAFKKLKLSTIIGIIIVKITPLLKILRLFKRFKIIKGY